MSDRDEMLRLERLCLEQAEEAGTPEGRAALLQLARSYRAEANRTAGNNTKEKLILNSGKPRGAIEAPQSPQSR